jgi:hypothetical protein
MEELISSITSKTGISSEQAQQAIDMTLEFVKDKLPAPIASQVDGVLSGKGGADALKSIGGLFGKK